MPPIGYLGGMGLERGAIYCRIWQSHCPKKPKKGRYPSGNEEISLIPLQPIIISTHLPDFSLSMSDTSWVGNFDARPVRCNHERVNGTPPLSSRLLSFALHLGPPSQNATLPRIQLRSWQSRPVHCHDEVCIGISALLSR